VTVPIIAFAVAVILLFFVAIGFASRYKRCPSDKILVVYGSVGTDRSSGGTLSAKCLHGGAAFVWPVIQDYAFLDLTPMPIEVKLEGALSQQNIRINTPSTFTVGISTMPGVMENAAERLLGLSLHEVKELARDIIFGQMRVVIATMPIEEINADRDKLISKIMEGVEGELEKIGIRLINVNIQDITDESGYIEALGKEAAAKAINEAKIKVAEQQRGGEIGSAEALRDQRINVASANATAVEGENEAKIRVANSDAKRRSQEAEAERVAIAAEKVASAKALQEAYAAEQQAETARAERELATRHANVVVPAEIEKKKVEILAEARAEQVRRQKKGEADGIRSVMEAEAAGHLAILTQKAEGFNKIIQAAGANPEFGALMMVTEQLPALVAEQVKAISNLKIDKVTVWDSGSNSKGKNSTSEFLSGLVGSIPPLHELAKNAGVNLPQFLGQMDPDASKADDTPEA
jgi:flotillin